MNGATREDVQEMRATILDVIASFRQEMHREFDATHQRQDVTNGRVRELEKEAARHDERIENLEGIEQVRHQATSQAMQAARLQPERRVSDETEMRPITRREVTLVAASTSAAVAATVGILKFFRMLLP
jgi:hypothetical protein